MAIFARSLALFLAVALVMETAMASTQQSVTRETQQERRDTFMYGLDRRSEPNAPDGYTPQPISCPGDRPKIRNGTMGKQEKDWVLKRRNETIQPIKDLLRRLDIAGFDSDKYLRGVGKVNRSNAALPNIALAVSGGGYRAMTTGAGALAAWDIRSDGSDGKGNLGGLLQSATYLSALSGGGWLVGSLYVDNFTSVQDSLSSPIIWQLDQSIFDGPNQYSLLGYYDAIIEDVQGKANAGFKTSITDYWGRMLSYQLVNATNGQNTPSYTFSSIANLAAFAQGKTPFPFLVADGRSKAEHALSPTNSTVFEFTPWELGSSDPTLHGHVPLKYTGSKFVNGTLPKSSKCIAGFDNAGFVMGTSSSLFNSIVLYLNEPQSSYVPNDVPSFVKDALQHVLDGIGDDNNDASEWSPNPFRGWNPRYNKNADNSTLTLVDGSEDLQNIPYHPLTLMERKVDVIFSLDSSADTESGWPAGAAAVATYQRSLSNISEGTSFPTIPDTHTFRNLGLNTRPTFFGCNASNMSDPTPLVVYIPNYPYLFQSNTSTFQMQVNNSERDAMVQNGYAVVTQLNSTRDPNWPACVGCAILARSFNRTNTTVPATCKRCFDSYCWNGTIDNSKPAPYYPEIYSTPINVDSGPSDSSPAAVVSSSFMGALALTVAASLGISLAF